MSSKYQNIISFLPSATEILFELNLDKFLKGVTHACIYPDAAKDKPKIITCSIDVNNLDSFEIDKKIKELYVNNKKLFVLDHEKIKTIQPDLVISQNVCEVCAPPFENELIKVREILGYTPKNLILNPKTLDEIIDSIVTVGKEVGNLELAFRKADLLTKRIKHIDDKVREINNSNNSKYKIICLEWISPFYVAGHWIPQMVEIAGGLNGISKRGADSNIISMEEIESFDPDIIIIMPCGFDISKTESDLTRFLKNNKRWHSLRAVKMNQIYIVDANSYFSKPNPRIVTGIEIIAKILYPDELRDLKVPLNSFKKIKMELNNSNL
ncbi:MAG: cobalamin-binding protein [Candidatus Nitrosocosmicus sp.]